MSGIVAKLDGVTLSAPVWLIKPGPDLQAVTSADGGAAFGHLLIDDAAGTIRIKGWQYITLDVPACTDAPRLFTGYVGQRVYTRGPYKDGPGRQIICELYDLNIILGHRPINGGDADRTAETDTARTAWLLGSAYLSGLVQDLGLVNTTGLTFDAANYHGQYANDVLRDLTTTYEQIFFVYWDQVAEAAGLFFDFADANTNVSTMRISNDMADVLSDMDGLTVYPFVDAELEVDPINVHSTDRFVFSGGVIYLTKQATIDEFFTDNGLGTRGLQLELDKIGTPTTATTFAQRDLDAHDHEEITITCTVRLPADQVNLIDGGMLIPVKFTHMPDYGFDDFTNMRVQSRSVTQPLLWDKHSGDLDALFDVTLTLAVTGVHSIGGGGGGTGVVPQQPPAAPTVVQTGCGFSLGGAVEVDFDNPVSIGHMIVVAIVWRDGMTDNANVDTNPGIATVHNYVPFTELGRTHINSNATQETGLFSRIVTADDFIEGDGTKYSFGSGAGSGRPKILAWELEGVDDADDTYTDPANGAGTPFGFGPLTVSGPGIAIAAVGMGTDNPEPLTIVPASGAADHTYVEVGDHFWQTVAAVDKVHMSPIASESYTVSFTVSGGGNQREGIAAFFPASSSNAEGPAHGQWSQWKTVTVTAGAFNLGFAYATGSVEVKVDGVLISPASYVETDNTTGDVTLSWSTDTDEVVTARAQGI